MKILFVTPECGPWTKTGGLGDVSASLPRALTALGHEVVVLTPAYRALSALVAGGEVRARIGPQGPWPAARLVSAHPEVARAAGFELLMLETPELFGEAGGPYQDERGRDHPNNAARFGWLCQVAARLGSGGASPWPAWRPDVVHCNDWPTGLVPAYMSRLVGRAASVMTIHNLAFQGLFPMHEAARLDLPDAWLGIDGLEFWGQVSFMKAGLQFADALTTVSPTYAREIQDEPLGCGLQGVLRERAGRLTGILNGIDPAVWNPALDPHLARRYDAATVRAGKRANKAALQSRLGLKADPDAMLFAVVSRLTGQKGIDLIAPLLPWLLGQGAQFVALGQGDPRLEDALRLPCRAHPGQAVATIGFDEPLAHLIEAGADCFLMPSRFEPCGLNQMYSLAYGTPPIVHRTGGLADSVVDEATHPGRGTGWAFGQPRAEALQAAIERALACHRSPPCWLRLQERGMRQNFDWSASARQYEALYLGLREASVGLG